ncbi:trafficking protein particle complex subunit 2, partial [Kipferlia bialata]|eukprot:g13158.t1
MSLSFVITTKDDDPVFSATYSQNDRDDDYREQNSLDQFIIYAALDAVDRVVQVGGDKTSQHLFLKKVDEFQGKRIYAYMTPG